MKKSYLGLLGLGCGVLLLTGCGGSAHTLTCTQKSDEQEMTITVYYNDDETKAEKIKAESIYDASNVSDEEFKKGKEHLEQMCDASGYKNCKVTTSGKKVIMTFESDPETFGYDGRTLKEVKESAVDSGFSCK